MLAPTLTPAEVRLMVIIETIHTLLYLILQDPGMVYSRASATMRIHELAGVQAEG